MRTLFAVAFMLIPFVASAQQEKPVDPYQKLRDSWPKLLEAWKATTAFKAELAKDLDSGKYACNTILDKKVPLLPDSVLLSVGRTALALEAAGLMGSETPPELEAFKVAFKARLSSVLRIQGLSLFSTPKTQEEMNRFSNEYNQVQQIIQQEYQNVYNEWAQRQGGRVVNKNPKPRNAVGELEEASFALAKMKESGTIEDDLEQDALAKLRKALRELGIMDDETPQWMRTRITAMVKAISLGDPLPEPAKATADVEKKVSELLSTLQTGDIAAREEATKELCRVCEPCVGKVRQALADATEEETRIRLRKVLGFRTDKKEDASGDEEPQPGKIIRRRGVDR